MRDVAGQHRDEHENERHGNQRGRIPRRHIDEQAAHHPAGDVDARHTDQHAKAHQQNALAEDESQDAAVGRAECKAHGELGAASCHGSGNQPEQPHRDQQQGSECKACDEHGADARLPQRVGHDLVHRPHLGYGNTWIHLPDGASHVRNQRPRIAPGLEDEERCVRASILGPQDDLRPPVPMQLVEPGLLDNADDRHRTSPVRETSRR